MWFLVDKGRKIDLLGHFLAGTVERYYHKQVETWWVQQPSLEHVMEQLHLTFKTTITASQAMKLFMAKKEARRAWAEHFLYMVPSATRVVAPTRLCSTTLCITRRQS